MAGVSFAEVDVVVDELRAADISASIDPAEINPPGVWVRTAGLSLDLLGGFTIKTQLHLVVADNGHHEARAALVDLFNQVLTVATPDEDPYFQGLVLPDNPKPLPGLVVPVNLSDTYQE